MANVYAVKSGNWSDTTVWNTGALPTSADDVYANGYTVTIDTSPTVLSIRNGAASPIVKDGSFVPTNGITLTCTGSGIVPDTSNTATPCFVSSLTSGQSCTVISNVTGGGNNSPGISNTSSGTVNVTGNLTGRAGAGSNGAQNNSSGTLNITGNVSPGTFGADGIANLSSGAVNITGDITGHPSSSNAGAGTANSSTGTVSVTGNVTGGVSLGLSNTSTGTVNVTGNVEGGASAYGVSNDSSGTLNHVGTVSASPTYPAIAPGSSSQNTFFTGPFIGTAQGIAATIAIRWRWIPSVGASYMTAVNSDATGYKNLYTADSTGSNSGQPAASNVRSGTIYGPNSELTGTCAVPAANSVAFGVSVDATTGTAVLTPESVRSAVGLASANLDSQLSRVANVATTQEVADIVEGAVSA